MIELKLRELRIEKGLTQKELAKKINSTDKNVWAYEKGIATPPYEVLISYAKFFEVSTDYILGLEDDFEVKSYNLSGQDERYSDEEKEIIRKYRRINEKFKMLVKQQLDIFSE